MPERSGVILQGDYLHGRDKNDIAWAAFERAYDRLVEEQGPDMNAWKYETRKLRVGDLLEVDYRSCGAIWIATEFGDRVRSRTMAVSGQSENPNSPHYDDQLDLFVNWELKEMPFYPDEFPPRESQ
jgi:acyl-homoserine lactone acylase PvdQ